MPQLREKKRSLQSKALHTPLKKEAHWASFFRGASSVMVVQILFLPCSLEMR